jgi:hypothetical protein
MLLLSCRVTVFISSFGKSWPNVHSKIYEGKVFVKNTKDFKAITVVNKKQCSLPLTFK